MAIKLSQETEQLIEEQREALGIQSVDDLIRFALEALASNLHADDESIDDETMASLDEAIAQADRGEGIPLAEVRAEFETRSKNASTLRAS